MPENSETVQQNTDYDFIIAGAGCAGLSLLYSILQSPLLNQKSILVLDKSFEKSNDRTWCFWETSPSVFDSLVCKKWEKISVHKNDFSTQLSTYPFEYKMIQGVDFYQYVMQFAKSFPNVHWKEATIHAIEVEQGKGVVHWETGNAKSKYVFSSILPMETLYAMSQSSIQVPFLWQHFKGRLIEFSTTLLDATVARLMDFNVDQKSDTGFMYVLPLTDRQALVEYTLFSPSILNPLEYDKEIDNYLQTHFPEQQYQVLHEEVGAIPMTMQRFDKTSAPIYVIGTLGNAVKASTGYAFKFIQNQVRQIVTAIEKVKPIQTEVHNTRHQFYDAVLLYILQKRLMEGSEIFKRIFEKNKAATIFKFLSNTSTIWEDIQIMRSLPTRIFLPAAIKVLLRRG
jgi:lycopene beta-cyclase